MLRFLHCSGSGVHAGADVYACFNAFGTGGFHVHLQPYACGLPLLCCSCCCCQLRLCALLCQGEQQLRLLLSLLCGNFCMFACIDMASLHTLGGLHLASAASRIARCLVLLSCASITA